MSPSARARLMGEGAMILFFKVLYQFVAQKIWHCTGHLGGVSRCFFHPHRFRIIFSLGSHETSPLLYNVQVEYGTGPLSTASELSGRSQQLAGRGALSSHECMVYFLVSSESVACNLDMDNGGVRELVSGAKLFSRKAA